MTTTRKILIADDQEIERTALREILRAEPTWEILEAKDGEEAMDLLCQGHPPDVCLLDLRMPRLDGVAMLQRLRRDPNMRDLKVIITTGTRDKDTILALAKLNISGYILKPFTTQIIMAALRPILEPAAAAPGHFSKNLLCKTALIVDDNATERIALRDIIKSESDWESVQSEDGSEALLRLHDGLRPDIVFVDLRMPKIDGYTLIQRIREDPALRNLRIVVISSEQDRERVRSLAQLNISGYLLKPFDTVKVKAVLRQAAGVPEETSAETTAQVA
jgi:CheY-like chemotaxis protein